MIGGRRQRSEVVGSDRRSSAAIGGRRQRSTQHNVVGDRLPIVAPCLWTEEVAMRSVLGIQPTDA